MSLLLPLWLPDYGHPSSYKNHYTFKMYTILINLIQLPAVTSSSPYLWISSKNVPLISAHHKDCSFHNEFKVHINESFSLPLLSSTTFIFFTNLSSIQVHGQGHTKDLVTTRNSILKILIFDYYINPPPPIFSGTSCCQNSLISKICHLGSFASTFLLFCY